MNRMKGGDTSRETYSETCSSSDEKWWWLEFLVEVKVEIEREQAFQLWRLGMKSQKRPHSGFIMLLEKVQHLPSRAVLGGN